MKEALGDEESKRGRGSWRKGLILPAQTHATSCCPLPVLSLKSLPVFRWGNPHASLKKCVVNSVCLSSALFCHFFPFGAPFFTLSMMCFARQWRAVHSLHVCVCVCVCTCMCAHGVCQTLSISSTQPRAKASIARGSACNVGRPVSWTQAEYQRHTADTPPSSPPADLRDPNFRRRGGVLGREGGGGG